MQRLLLAGVAVSAAVAGAGATMTSPAVAADVARVYKGAPAPIASPLPSNWTGFYVGAHLGGAWGTKEALDPFAGKSPSMTVNGFLGGVQAGYNHQFNWVVVGIEGQFSWANVEGGGLAQFCCAIGSINVKSPWFATLTGRIGGTVDHALLYVKGGFAWVRDEWGINCIDCTLTSAPAQKREGWTIGAGVEYAFTPNWSGKLEYNFMDFGNQNTGTFLCSGNCASSFDGDVRQHMHLVKAGVNYRFDWGKGPVAGKGPVVTTRY